MSLARRHIAPSKKVKTQDKLSVVILAAGTGRRMIAKGSRSLMLLNKTTCVLQHQINTIMSVYPNADIVAVTGFEHEKVRQHMYGQKVRFVQNYQYEHRGMAHGLSLGLDACTVSPVLVMHGDIVFNKYALVGIDNASCVLLAPKNISRNKIGVTIQDGVATHFSYTMPEKWGQIAFVQEKELELLRSVVFDDGSGHLLLYEVLNKVIDNGGILKCHTSDKMEIVEIDKNKDLQYARTII